MILFDMIYMQIVFCILNALSALLNVYYKVIPQSVFHAHFLRFTNHFANRVVGLVVLQVKTNGARNTELFKPKQLPKPSLSTATPLNGNKSHWVSMGLTTPKPVQKAILYESMCDDDQYRALISGYEELRKQLLDERRKNALMELKVREEVCAEMSEQLVEIERDYR